MAKIHLPTYDIIIFGASGFTGKYVVREALKFLNSPNSHLKSLALAGRNYSKLTETLKWASKSHPCGFDSIPAELGFMFNSKQWVSPAVPNRSEAYLSLESDKRIVGNIGTFESAVYGVANAHKLPELRRSRPRRTRPQVMAKAKQI